MGNTDVHVVCFGEILWDNLPGGRKPGGAPMNVAYHLNQLGIKSTLISRVGSDNNGSDLLEFIRAKGLSTEYCERDLIYNTSTVEVTIGTDHEVNYEIVAPVAWDFIISNDRMEDIVALADAFVFGSLAARNSVTFNTLQTLLGMAKNRVFDVNLRQPHFTKDRIALLLKQTDLLKLNLNELTLISAWFDGGNRSESEKIKLIQDQFGLKQIILTKGAAGASFYTETEQLNFASLPVVVKDTIGSGDSFLAAFLSQHLRDRNIQESMVMASALGAYITTQSGACPYYKISDLNRFISLNTPGKSSH